MEYLHYGFRIAPRHFYTSESKVLVLEDLLEIGYKMGDRHQQLNFSECVTALRTLASFHAGSFKLNENSLNIMDIIKTESCWKNPEFTRNVTHTAMNILITVLQDDISPLHVRKLISLKEEIPPRKITVNP